MNEFTYPTGTLIDPQARVIDLASSTRALKLIHRSLLSHLRSLNKKKGGRQNASIDGESFYTEYNSTAQLAKDIRYYLEGRKNA